MKESLISLTPIISNSIDTDNESDLLINNNKNNNCDYILSWKKS